jgi:hypothetical protein
MIVDSSVWIAHVRGRDSAARRRLVRALREESTLYLVDVVFMEVLQGARSPDSFWRLQDQLERLTRLAPRDSHNAARHAALLYARCRWQGFTPRSGNDCLIACIAIETGEPVLHENRDFPRIAAVEPALKLVRFAN